MTVKPINTPAPSAEELKAAVDLLERIARDRTLLARASIEERTRLLQAAGEVFCPDVSERRRLTSCNATRAN